jgi:shikimate kinase
MKKIALIGIMGSGKTTLGKILAERMGNSFICSDEYLEEKLNRTIPDIFEKDGEAYFREMEAEVIKELSEREELILSTGGGVVLDEKNMENLKDNGFVVVFLNRDVEIIMKDIDTEDRPLIKEDPEKLRKIFSDRKDLYNGYSDIILNNDGQVEEAVDKLINIISSVD